MALIVFELIDQPKSHNFIMPCLTKKSYIVNDYVLRLEITMDDFIFVHIIQGLKSLLHDVPCVRFGDFSLFFQEVIQLARKT